jgi:hypothetical protein
MKCKVYILIVLLSSCNKRSESYNLPDKSDIYEIIKTVVYEEELPVVNEIIPDDTIINNDGSICISSFSPIPLSIDLVKIKFIYTKGLSGKDIPPLPTNTQNISYLLDDKINNEFFFCKQDSQYIVFQNEKFNKFRIEEKYLSDFLLTSNEEQENKLLKGGHVNYFNMTIPIFSEDNNRAYIEVNHCMSGDGGYGDAIYLEKIDEKWKVLHISRLWIS